MHFGEQGSLEDVHGWAKAISSAADADLIVCLGTSLKVGTQSDLQIF